MLANLFKVVPHHNFQQIQFQQPEMRLATMPIHKLYISEEKGLQLQSLSLMQNMVTWSGNVSYGSGVTEPPNFYLSFEQMVRKYGFQVDSYSVTTQDHYVLGNFRIRTPGLKAGAPAVFLQHGLFSCSDTWIVNQELVAPAYQLARAGYDVYLGNNRGNFYSNKNTELNPVTDDEAFHNYSFDKYGEYDLTSQVTTALAMSGQSKLTFMGHSQGTTQMFYELSTNQEWIKEHVNLFVALAPIANMKNSTAVKPLSDILEPTWKILDTVGVWEIFKPSIKQKLIDVLDSPLLKWAGLVNDLVAAVADAKYGNKIAGEVSSNRFPNETSVKSLIHLGLLNKEGNFVNMLIDKPCFFDCASNEILPLNQVTLPIALFNGAEDPLADTTDVDWLATQLQNVVYRMVVPNAGHGLPQLNDMSYFTHVMALVQQYNPVTPSLQNLNTLY